MGSTHGCWRLDVFHRDPKNLGRMGCCSCPSSREPRSEEPGRHHTRRDHGDRWSLGHHSIFICDLHVKWAAVKIVVSNNWNLRGNEDAMGVANKGEGEGGDVRTCHVWQGCTDCL